MLMSAETRQGRCRWWFTYSMHRVTAACIGITACLHLMGWLAWHWAQPQPRHLACYYAASLASLLTFYAYITLLVGVDESLGPHDSGPQPWRDYCDAITSATVLVASCAGPPLLLLLLLHPSFALLVLACVAAAAVLGVLACWGCMRLVPSARAQQSTQLIVSPPDSRHVKARALTSR